MIWNFAVCNDWWPSPCWCVHSLGEAYISEILFPYSASLASPLFQAAFLSCFCVWTPSLYPSCQQTMETSARRALRPKSRPSWWRCNCSGPRGSSALCSKLAKASMKDDMPTLPSAWHGWRRPWWETEWHSGQWMRIPLQAYVSLCTGAMVGSASIEHDADEGGLAVGLVGAF